MELSELTIAQAHNGLKKKAFSCEELVKSCLNAIEKNNENINAYITVYHEKALEQAKHLDRSQNFSHPLSGIPLAVKDNIVISGEKTTAGSQMLKNYIAPYDATVIAKLKKARAVFLGKTNMDEFACGSSNETSFFGPVKNPHDPERVPGGSSGGSAAAVAAHQCLAALGSDTGGSIRQPASFCGVVGLKPTYGRVSRYGLIAMASSLDQIGPLTKTVEDAALLLQTLAGPDPNDSTTVDTRENDFTPAGKDSLKNIRIGIPKEYLQTSGETAGLQKEVREAVLRAIRKLEQLGAEIDDTISLPHTPYALAVYYILMPSELSSNLERYDGIRYGFSVRKGKTLLEDYLLTRGSGFGHEIRRRIMLGTYALSAGYYDAYYKKALQVRTRIIRDFERAFQRVHCLITPTTPTIAFRLGEKVGDPLSMYLSDIYTVSANIAGIPAISVPCGETPASQGEKPLPIGLQVMGKHFDEKTILTVAQHVLEEI